MGWGWGGPQGGRRGPALAADGESPCCRPAGEAAWPGAEPTCRPLLAWEASCSGGDRLLLSFPAETSNHVASWWPAAALSSRGPLCSRVLGPGRGWPGAVRTLGLGLCLPPPSRPLTGSGPSSSLGLGWSVLLAAPVSSDVCCTPDRSHPTPVWLTARSCFSLSSASPHPPARTEPRLARAPPGRSVGGPCPGCSPVPAVATPWDGRSLSVARPTPALCRGLGRSGSRDESGLSRAHPQRSAPGEPTHAFPSLSLPLTRMEAAARRGHWSRSGPCGQGVWRCVSGAVSCRVLSSSRVAPVFLAIPWTNAGTFG